MEANETESIADPSVTDLPPKKESSYNVSKLGQKRRAKTHS